MTPDEVNRLWQQSQDDAKGMSLGFTTQQHYFAALVAAAERNKIATWTMEKGYATGHGDTLEELLYELDWQIRESEREACAKLVESEWSNVAERMYGHECAAAIRARGGANEQEAQ